MYLLVWDEWYGLEKTYKEFCQDYLEVTSYLLFNVKVKYIIRNCKSYAFISSNSFIQFKFSMNSRIDSTKSSSLHILSVFQLRQTYLTRYLF